MVAGVGVVPTRRFPFEGFYVPCVFQFRHPGWTVRGKARSPCHRFQLTCQQRDLEREIQKIQDLTDNPDRQQVLIPPDISPDEHQDPELCHWYQEPCFGVWLHKKAPQTRYLRGSSYWRPRSESNRRTRICNPLHDHSRSEERRVGKECRSQ